MKQKYKYLLLSVLMVLMPVLSGAADVVSENLVFMKADGRSYLLQRSMRTSWDEYDFHVDRKTGLAEFFYIDPNEYEWDDASDTDVNTLKFKHGSFTVMYPGSYGERVSIDGQGVYTLNTRDGMVREDGHFGMWNSPDDFNRFVHAWVFPESFRILTYESNREGKWIERQNTLAFFAQNVNDLEFTVRYELVDSDRDGVADNNDRCPDTLERVAVDAAGCEPDSDHDAVIDRLDECPNTPVNSMVDMKGCELDEDADGVTNRLDHCAGTPAGAVVDVHGCELDSDLDGVVDRLDQCPSTISAAMVDQRGCELDYDEDGIINSADKCPRTPVAARVDERGCELDGDADGVPDSRDRCPETPATAGVDERGCELDGDADGVPDSRDRCPETPAAVGVDERGCELDKDRDGVVDRADLCLDTVPGTSVDETGCDPRQPIELQGVNFHFNSDQLTEASIKILSGVAGTLRAHPDLKLEVAGHTDAAGDAAFNLDLSQRRAETVRSYLVANGVKADHLMARGYGEEQPIESNATEAGRSANRRVELVRE